MSYTIDSNSFSVYNMTVLSSIGALDFPERLGDVDYDWADSNGVEAYVSSSDLHWDGREISLLVYYNGSNMYSDLATFRGLYEGQNSALVTTYGSHTATLKEIKINQVERVNQKAILVLKFWEPSVSVPSVPSATGGSGVKIGAFDLRVDFGLKVAGQKGLYDHKYNARERSYGNQPKQYSDVPDPRRITLLLNGHYSNASNLISNVNNLHAVLRSSGLKVLSYNGITANVYFGDNSKVTVILQAFMVSIRLKLRLGEVLSYEDAGQVIYYPKDDNVIFYPGAGKIIYPGGNN